MVYAASMPACACERAGARKPLHSCRAQLPGGWSPCRALRCGGGNAPPASTHPSQRLPPPPSSRQRRGSGRCASRHTAAAAEEQQGAFAASPPLFGHRPLAGQPRSCWRGCPAQHAQRLHGREPQSLPAAAGRVPRAQRLRATRGWRSGPAPARPGLACMLRAMRWRHQAKPSAACAFQSYRGLPHSWPVALKASGGTPLRGRVGGGGVGVKGRGAGKVGQGTRQPGRVAGPARLQQWMQPRLSTSVEACRPHPRSPPAADPGGAPDKRGGAVGLQLKQAAVGPHIGALPAHIDGHVAHQADAAGVGVGLGGSAEGGAAGGDAGQQERSFPWHAGAGAGPGWSARQAAVSGCARSLSCPHPPWQLVTTLRDFQKWSNRNWRAMKVLMRSAFSARTLRAVTSGAAGGMAGGQGQSWAGGSCA